MNPQEEEQLVIKTARLFEKHDSNEAAIVSELEEQGYANVEARKICVLVETAFAWAFIKKMGVSIFPSEFVVINDQGSFKVPVASQHLFITALEVASSVLQNGYNEQITRATFQAVTAHSAEVNALSKALDAGSDISGGSILSAFVDFEPVDFGLQKKARWQFWRKPLKTAREDDQGKNYALWSTTLADRKSFVEQCLLQNFTTLGVPIEKVAGGIRIMQGTPIVQVQDVKVWQPRIGADWLAHVEVVYALNPEIIESSLYDCGTYWGKTVEAAMSSAAEAICKTSAPPILSLLHSKAVLEADFFAPDDPFGFPGWEAFSSPYVVKGNNEANSQQLVTYFQENPMWSQLGKIVEGSFDKPMLNTIRLYIGFDGTNYHAECRVNNEIHEEMAQALSELNLPRLEGFASICQYLLLLHKSS